MKNKILKILSSLLLVSSISLSFTGCNNKTTQEQQPNTTTRPSRKPQVNLNSNNLNKDESVYADGEIINLVDGSKLKYSVDGNHQLLEQGDGKVIIFKTTSQEDINKLTPEQKTMVERQKSSDPNGFLVIY